MSNKDTGRHIECVILDEFAQRSNVPGYDYRGDSIFSLPIIKALSRQYSPNTMALLGLPDPDDTEDESVPGQHVTKTGRSDGKSGGYVVYDRIV